MMTAGANKGAKMNWFKKLFKKKKAPVKDIMPPEVVKQYVDAMNKRGGELSALRDRKEIMWEESLNDPELRYYSWIVLQPNVDRFIPYGEIKKLQEGLNR